VALGDIIDRIEGDAVREGQSLVDAAEAEAERLLTAARNDADAGAERMVAKAEQEAARDAATIVAAARLAARDEALAGRRALIGRAMTSVAERLVALPDAEYTAFLAGAIATSARGDERVLVAAADRGRLGGLAAAVEARARKLGRELALTYPDEPAPIANGVLLDGERESVDLSIAGLIETRRELLVMDVADALFSPGGDE
jgi:vacuolar-type H+-ATPase subunit E/Vma4